MMSFLFFFPARCCSVNHAYMLNPYLKQIQQGIHRHRALPRYRNAASRYTAHYGQTLHHPQNWKYITYQNAARGGPSHGHRGSAQKIL